MRREQGETREQGWKRKGKKGRMQGKRKQSFFQWEGEEGLRAEGQEKEKKLRCSMNQGVQIPYADRDPYAGQIWPN